MSKSADHFNLIAIEALSLSAKERGDLAARLLRSLDREKAAEDDVNLAIATERLEKFKRGEMESYPAEEVIREVREKYGI